MPPEIVYWGPPLSGRSSNLRVLASRLGGEVARDAGILRVRTKAAGGEIVMKAIESPLYDERQYRAFTAAADGFVLVVDAQRWQLEANRSYVSLLRRFLKESGRSLDDLPVVVQVNKSDVENSFTPAELLDLLELKSYPFVSAVAESGLGVEATLDALIQQLAARTERVESDPVSIREATVDDAEALLELQLALDAETPFMMLEPEERSRSLDERRRSLRDFLGAPNCTFLLAFDGNEIVGLLEARGGAFRRNRHAAEIVVGVRQSHSGRGIARRLFLALDRWAQQHGVARLELTVMVHNDRARRLYERAGYRVEGTKQHALRVGDEWVDEYLMAKLL